MDIRLMTAGRRLIDFDFMSSLPFGLTYSKSSSSMYFDNTGTYTWASENLIPNSSTKGGIGGSPGILPTGWAFYTPITGLSTTLSYGTEDNIPYMDIRLSGTPSAADVHLVQLSPTISCAIGEAFTVSAYVKLVGGSLSGITSTRIAWDERASGAYVTTKTSTYTATSEKTRYSMSDVISGANVNGVQPQLRIYVATSPIDITLRYYLPQLEHTAYNSPIEHNITTGTAYYGPRFEYDPITLDRLGLLLEGQRTNLIRNNTTIGGVAGSPGTLPKNWGIYALGTGLTRTLSYGTEYGMPYIDIRLVGTPAGDATYAVFFEQGLFIPAVQNDIVTVSAFLRLSGGSLTNISSITIFMDEKNSSGSYLASGAQAVTVTSQLNYTPHKCTRTLTNVNTAFVGPAFRIMGILGQPMDITLRVYLPQCEKAASATSRIPTLGGAVTRASDNLSLTNLPWFNPLEGTMYVSASTLAASAAMLAEFNDNSFNNRITCGEISGGSTVIGSLIASAGIPQGTIQTNRALVTDSDHRVAHSWKVNQRFAARNGVLGTPDTEAVMPTSITRLKFGDVAGGSSSYAINGHLRAFKYWNYALQSGELQTITALP